MKTADAAGPAPEKENRHGTLPFLTFGQTAHRLRDNGYAPLPVEPGTKETKIKDWTGRNGKSYGAGTIDGWVRRFASHSVGAMTGYLVGIDIDLLDPGSAYEAEQSAVAAFGATPLIRIGQAPKRVLCYRTVKPFAQFRDGSIEILGLGRQVLLFGIHPYTVQPYRWVGDSPLDVPLSDLPKVSDDGLRRWLNARTAAERTASVQVLRTGSVGKGSRNTTLFPYLLDVAWHASTRQEVSDRAAEFNSTCRPPEVTGKVEAVVDTVWGYKLEGHLRPPSLGPASTIFRHERRALLAAKNGENGLALLSVLRDIHGHHGGTIAIVPESMAEAGHLPGWSKQRVIAARQILEDLGFLKCLHVGGGRNNPSRYQLIAAPVLLVKGNETTRDIIDIPPAPSDTALALAVDALSAAVIETTRQAATSEPQHPQPVSLGEHQLETPPRPLPDPKDQDEQPTKGFFPNFGAADRVDFDLETGEILDGSPPLKPASGETDGQIGSAWGPRTHLRNTTDGVPPKLRTKAGGKT